MIEVINPATGAAIATYYTHTPAQVEARLAQAAAAQRCWAERPLAERCAALVRLAAVLRAGRDTYARLIVSEMGKPLLEAEAEIEKSALTCEFYAEQAPGFLADTPVASAAADSRVVYDPLGVVLAVMPWNYPFWQFVRFAAPALAAGNGAILKHASNVPGCALALEQAFAEADLPTGLVATLLIEAREVAGVLADPRIAAVTLTGSTAVGQQVASQAGALMKKQVLELAARTPSSYWPMPTWPWPRRPRSRRASATPVRAAFPPSASSSPRQWPMPSPRPSPPLPPACGWAIRLSVPPRSVRWPAPVCARICSAR